ncbi:hypothetical protein H9Q13_09250 [Pontibacter sp. JH31]|uniref:Uncharacterized protein n=1 Tax=Pontibacter aquaedesilientis TaxID=2766980 RepID=A0ABR7XGC4_9BACT|nr:hypothetical protein [Pontibacter aquaedesilientis]MBD1397349.1 hypothetical protein [Pontibacter aquaedesilientis]
MKRDELLEKVKHYDFVIADLKRSIGDRSIDVSVTTDKRTTSSIKQNNLFSDILLPAKLSFDDQVVEVFERIGRFVKINDFAAIFINQTNTSKSTEGIISVVRRLKNQGRVVNVKFNNNFANTYWGLPIWVKEHNKQDVLLKEHFPVSDEVSEDSIYEVNRQ